MNFNQNLKHSHFLEISLSRKKKKKKTIAFSSSAEYRTKFQFYWPKLTFLHQNWHWQKQLSVCRKLCTTSVYHCTYFHSLICPESNNYLRQRSWGGIVFTPVCLFVCLFVCLSVCEQLPDHNFSCGAMKLSGINCCVKWFIFEKSRSKVKVKIEKSQIHLIGYNFASNCHRDFKLGSYFSLWKPHQIWPWSWPLTLTLKSSLRSKFLKHQLRKTSQNMLGYYAQGIIYCWRGQRSRSRSSKRSNSLNWL